NVVHHALEKFCQLFETGAETNEEKRSCWQNITDKKRDELLRKINSEIIEKSGINVSEEPKMQSVFSRILSTVTKASDMIILMMKRGKYDIYANEMEFEDFSVSGASGDVLFHGIIDRLDVFEEDGKTKIRIVDYKTGDKKFNLADALNGIDLQLIVYAMAAEKLIGGNSEISGFFYNSLKKKVASCKNPEEVASEVSKLYKLAGTVVEKMLDNTYEIKTGADMDCELISTQFSSFLPLKLTTKGVYDRYSSVQNPEFMNEIYRNVRNVASEAAHAVEEGDVRVYPYVTSSKDSCKFCPYASVCMYDHCRGVEINTGQHGRELLNEIKKNNQ
ncbi:MAG: PD-(D/E)XK nuclease family protein, partial [Clostridia bacterium]|nr:PD-(D/E)XK nuclease family protein [Clostridia bacterium]